MKTILAVVAIVIMSGVCHAEERWANFAEDGDQKYYLDQKSVTPLPDNVFIFWVKSIAKDREFYKKEYNLNNLSYIFTNYELDCATSTYKVRGIIMYDKNRRELNKSLPAGGEAVSEPVPPESMLELAQTEVCSKASVVKEQAPEQPVAATPAAKPPVETAAAEPPSIQ